MTRARRWSTGLAIAIAVAAVPTLAVVVGADDQAPGTADPVPASPVVTPPGPVPAPAAESSRVTVVTAPAAASPDAPLGDPAPTAPDRQEAGTITTRPATTVGRASRSTARDLTVRLTPGDEASDLGVTASLLVTNPNGFAVDAVEVRVTTDGSRVCQLTADTPTSLQIGPSVVVAVDARSTTTVAVTCDLGAPLPVTLEATAVWDDGRLPGRDASTSITVDLPR